MQCSPLQSIAVYCTMHYELCTFAIHCSLCTYVIHCALRTMHCALCNLLHYALTCCTCQAGSPTEFIWPSLSINTSSKNHCHHNHWSQPNFFNMTTMIILVGLKGGHVRRRYLPKWKLTTTKSHNIANKASIVEDYNSLACKNVVGPAMVY